MKEIEKKIEVGKLCFSCGYVDKTIKVVPYVFNKNKTKIQDLLTQKVYDLNISKEDIEKYEKGDVSVVMKYVKIANDILAEEYAFDFRQSIKFVEDFIKAAYPVSYMVDKIVGEVNDTYKDSNDYREELGKKTISMPRLLTVIKATEKNCEKRLKKEQAWIIREKM